MTENETPQPDEAGSVPWKTWPTAQDAEMSQRIDAISDKIVSALERFAQRMASLGEKASSPSSASSLTSPQKPNAGGVHITPGESGDLSIYGKAATKMHEMESRASAYGLKLPPMFSSLSSLAKVGSFVAGDKHDFHAQTRIPDFAANISTSVQNTFDKDESSWMPKESSKPISFARLVPPDTPSPAYSSPTLGPSAETTANSLGGGLAPRSLMSGGDDTSALVRSVDTLIIEIRSLIRTLEDSRPETQTTQPATESKGGGWKEAIAAGPPQTGAGTRSSQTGIFRSHVLSDALSLAKMLGGKK